jgi:hypothetical protein
MRPSEINSHAASEINRDANKGGFRLGGKAASGSRLDLDMGIYEVRFPGSAAMRLPRSAVMRLPRSAKMASQNDLPKKRSPKKMQGGRAKVKQKM